MRTRILPKMLNSEVEEYLQHNDIIIVPVGTVEMHGGFPLDSETVISEAYALRMAEACDGLVLTGLPYFYAGATASGRGTVQVSVRQGIDYLSAIAHSLLRQGFKRQIYISFHGPAHMTCSPMVRDFFDETGVPILYMDLSQQLGKLAKDLFTSMDCFHAITVGAYQIMGRLRSRCSRAVRRLMTCSGLRIRVQPSVIALPSRATICRPPPSLMRPPASALPMRDSPSLKRL